MRETVRSVVGTVGGATTDIDSGSGAVDDPLAEVEVLTDEDGVSHVYADDLYTLAYANGYVQARDRLFQMDALRHIGYGNSAEIIGPGQLQSDIQVRRDLYSREELQRQYEQADEEIRTALQGFANGVNRQLVEMATSGRIPGEFLGLGHVPEPWNPVDSVAVMSYLIGFFGVDGGEELENAQRFAKLCETLGDESEAFEAYGDLNWQRVPDEHYTSIPRADLTVDGGEDVPDFAAVPDEQLALAKAAADAEPWGIERDVTKGLGGLTKGRRPATGVLSGLKWGSNAMAVSGELTETGRPMLFGGPQMGYYKPPVIHEIGLHGAGFDVVGVGVVGTPSIVIGRTPDFAWSVTSGYDDQVDTVAVELHPEDRHRYRPGTPFGDEGSEAANSSHEGISEWREMHVETVEHETSLLGALADEDEDNVVRVVEQEIARIEIDGERAPVVAWNDEENVAWAQRTTTRGDELAGAFHWTDVGRKEDLEGVKEALADFPFTFNFLYADAEDIAMIHTGRVPDRNPDLDHRFPAPADAHEWREMTDGTDLGIHVTNPSRGYVVQWNNAPVGEWRAGGDFEQRWGRLHRVDLLDRIVREKLGLDEGEGPEGAEAVLSVEDVKDVIREAATHDPNAGATAPLFVDAARESDDKQLAAMADELEAWGADDYPWRDIDNDDAYDDAGHAIWDETRRALQELVFEDRLAELTPELQFDPPKEVELDEWEDPHAGDHGRAIREVTLVNVLHGDADHDWLDGDSPAEVMRRAMEIAAGRLADQFGTDDPSEWLATEHQTEFMAIGATVETAMDMINRGSYNHVVALGEAGEPADTAESILPPSNSGHVPLSELVSTVRGNEPPHLTDQLDRYEDFEYKPMPLEREAVEERAGEERKLTVRRGRPVSVESAVRDRIVQELLGLAGRL